MKKWSKVSITIALLFIVSTPLIPNYVFAWEQELTEAWNYDSPYFTTHQWLANEAVKLSPSSSKMQWITNNILAFWFGVEAPYNDQVAINYVADETIYGDIDDPLVFYLDGTLTVVDAGLGNRAQEEYDKLVTALTNEEFEEAAFYAGAMSHYISQAGIWGAVWNPTEFGGAVNATRWRLFESMVEDTLDATDYEDPVDEWNSTVFTITPSRITPVDANQSTEDLATQTITVAQDLHDNFDDAITNANNWGTTYKNQVVDCLEWSVEAIYAALAQAMEDANLHYITIEEATFDYNDTDGHMSIDEFEVTYTNNVGTFTLTDVEATTFNFRLLNLDDNMLQPIATELEYDDIDDKWYFSDHLLQGAAARAEHALIFEFKMAGSAITYSNYTETFDVDFFEADLTSIRTRYNWVERTVDIWNVKMELTDLPEIGILEDNEVSSAEWILYTKGEGTQVGDAIGVPALDTEGNATHTRGNLTYHSINQTWSSMDNDIGWVYTNIAQQFYIVVLFTVIGLPVGYWRESSYAGQQTFEPYAQGQDDYWFVTRDHVINTSQPLTVFDPETLTLDVYGIEAYTDYQNLTLDYWQLHDKPIYGNDIRAYRWKIFLYDGIPSDITGELEWDPLKRYRYKLDIDVSQLPDNDFYIAASMKNMNVNSSIDTYGEPSEYFTISRPIPVIYYILPELFLAGFVVLFGWLVWYRPRKKRLEIEKERDEKLDKGFMD